ncbi:MAG TPA: chemotaxis response regulator protein-glutamate methylesterase [Dongiaceae bacterium]|nr:chemotaxis response regulator protein-glutamate methylesterase [Dongiaceae bacterium]
MNPITVLIVDDSAVVRQTLTEILADAPGISVMGSASDPYIATEKIRQQLPDVIILDIEMPRMDGITFLRKLMSQHPIPVVICSTLVGGNSDTQLNALESGAVEIIQKPTLGTRQFLQEARIQIIDAVKAAAKADVHKMKLAPKKSPQVKHTADVIIPAGRAMTRTTEKLILVGASTGGTEAIKWLLEDMPTDCPAIAIVQHMPEGFTRSFAERLNQHCSIVVKEARDGDSLLRGHALIAPGNKHMLVKRSGARYYVEIKDGPLVSRHRPSVDVLFRSGARYAGANAVGIIMTGMGDDGAAGLLEMHDAGAVTFGQDEDSCVVYGMPKEAFLRGAVGTQLPLSALAAAALKAAI